MDKAHLMVRGQKLVEYVRDLLQPTCAEILVVIKEEQTSLFTEVADVQVVFDPPGKDGPLAGIQAGLQSATHDQIFVTACDMPRLQPEAVRFVMDQLSGCDVAVPEAEGFYQPLHACFRKTCLPAVERALHRGEGRVRSFFHEVKVNQFTRATWADIPGFEASLSNVNTPESWEIFLRELS